MTGFKQTHQPSPWINDYGAFSLMPSVGKLSVLENERKLKFDHSNEIVEPHYYSVILDEIKTKVEFTVTDRSSFFKFNFPKSENSRIISPSESVIEKFKSSLCKTSLIMPCV